jgi:hypothetical protein
MRIHHVLRGGLVLIGAGIGAMSLTAPVGPGTASALAADAASATAAPSAGNAGAQAAAVPVAPAAVAVVVPEDEVASVPAFPVVHAGPGPATPVEGAITLIDPLVIER